jgi:hypothetical protein
MRDGLEQVFHFFEIHRFNHVGIGAQITGGDVSPALTSYLTESRRRRCVT